MCSNLLDRVRVGAVSYLNSKPLIEGLESFAPTAQLMLDYPSCLADDLRQNNIDVGLIPSVECFRNRNYEIVSDACVAARDAVLSVKLYSRVPVGNIQTVALDNGSRTSATLCQVILAKRYGVFPDVEPLPMQASAADTNADAILLIGDRAMHSPGESFEVTWDLGKEWRTWTGLPFVFAVWATRQGTDLGDVEQQLCQARDHGVAHLNEIADRESSLLGIDNKLARKYLNENLTYRLGSAERNGLRLFRRLATELGFAEEGGELVFRNCATTG